MPNIKDFLAKYSTAIDLFDLEIIISHILGKTREFVLAHPEYELTKCQMSNVKRQILRRSRHEPLAYILGEKEFYALKFKVNKNVLIPRPETEQIVELAAHNLKHITPDEKIAVIDIGTGSGNIIISVVKRLLNQESGIRNYYFYGIDVSSEALKIAKSNAKVHKISHNIKFLKGDLLSPIIHNSKFILHNSRLIILANLPYLSPSIYKSSQISVKKYEPKLALLSHYRGLSHYDKLLQQINLLVTDYRLPVTIFMEFSPEQKGSLAKLIKHYFPDVPAIFYKDLANKWRVCNFES